MGNEESRPKGLSVAVCLPGDREVKQYTIEGDVLDGAQKLVGGYLEELCVLPGKTGARLLVLVNEDGKRLKLPPNRIVRWGTRAEGVRGPILLVAMRDGEWIDMTLEMLIETAVQVASWPQGFIE